MKYSLGIDFGGGSSKATLLDERGVIAATNSVEYPTSSGAGGAVEQNPEDWFSATRQNIAAVLEKSNVSACDIAIVALDAATHTAVLLDKNDEILCPSIYWTDTRSIKEVEFLKANYAEKIKRIMLHSPGTIWTLPQLMYLKNNKPDIIKSCAHILFAKDFVRHKLTGDYNTDYIEAEGSMLFDYEKFAWSDELVALSGIDKNALPNVIAPTDIAGHITKSAAQITGLAEGTPVICGTTDTAAEVFASGAISEGQVSLKLATAGRICVVTKSPVLNDNFINYSHVIKGLWYPGTATKACASSYRWYRDTFGDTYKNLDAGAAEVPVGCDGLIYHPYLSGELTPYNNPNLCASFTGIRMSHTKAHFSRAVLEGVAMSMLDCKKTVDALAVPHENSAVIIGGGASSKLWRQITADALGMELKLKNNSDSSLGSAIIGGTAAGIFDTYENALALSTEIIGVTKPNLENHEKYQKLFAKYKAIQKSLEEIYNKN